MSSRSHQFVVESPRAVAASTRTQLQRIKRKFVAETSVAPPLPLPPAVRAKAKAVATANEDEEVQIDGDGGVTNGGVDEDVADSDDNSIEQNCGVKLGARVKATVAKSSSKWIAKNKPKPLVYDTRRNDDAKFVG